MNSNQYQEQLLQAANEVSDARELLAKAQAKLMTLVGHAYVFGVPQQSVLAPQQSTLPGAPKVDPTAGPKSISELPVSGTTEMPKSVPERRQPVPLPTLDFSDADLADVPRSPLSTPASRPAPTPAPAPAPEGPTEEVSESEKITAFEEQRKTEQLGHFTGSGSLFARYLSPAVHNAGKGFLRPDVAGLKQYNEDVTQLSTSKLMNWPTSFYRDRATKVQQFLVVCDKGAVVVSHVLDFHSPIYVSLKQPGNPTPLIPLDQIPLMDLLVLKESVERSLQALNDKAA